MFCLVLLVSQGCAKYHPMSLDGASKQAASIPELKKVQLYAEKIQHPLLCSIPFDLQDGLTPDEAAVLAVFANPVLRAERDRLAESEAQLVQAGLLPRPQLSLSIDRPSGGTTAGTNTALSFGLGFSISSLLMRPTRVRAARERKKQVDLSVAWMEVQVAAAAKASVFRLVAMKAQKRLMDALYRNSEQSLEALKQAEQAGLVSEQDVFFTRSTLQNIEIDREVMRKRFCREKLFLKRILGVPSNYPVGVQEGVFLPEKVELPSKAKLLSGLSHRRLDILALQHGYLSQEEAVRRAILGQFPKISLGFNHARDNSNLYTIGTGISIDLPFFNHNQGRIAQARATRKQLYDAFSNRIFQARSDVAELISQANSLARQIALTQKGLATMKKSLKQYREAFGQGTVSLQTVSDITDLYTRKQLECYAEKSDLAQAIIALSLSSGYYNFKDILRGPNSSVPSPKQSIKVERQ
ncbi:MAG: TolC family protein [Acidobacteria bacterium]|nr:TolC family protein [Acidobacteriota bacterium]